MWLRRLTLGWLCFTAVMAAGCSTTDQDDSRLSELESAIQAFYAAVEVGDKAAHAAMFTDSAIMMPNNGSLIRGKEDIGEAVMSGEDWVFRIRNLRHVEIELSGDMAYTVNEYEYTWHHQDAEPVWHPTKNIHIWRYQTPGGWKLHLDIWNSSSSLEG